jgi:hypothetical protein
VNKVARSKAYRVIADPAVDQHVDVGVMEAAGLKRHLCWVECEIWHMHADALMLGLAAAAAAAAAAVALLQVCDPRVLFSGRHDLREKAGKQPLDSWMWDGLPLDAALDKFAREGEVVQKGVFPWWLCPRT